MKNFFALGSSNYCFETLHSSSRPKRTCFTVRVFFYRNRTKDVLTGAHKQKGKNGKKQNKRKKMIRYFEFNQFGRRKSLASFAINRESVH